MDTNEGFEIKNNEKGRGVYSTKSYQAWDIIHVEKAVFAISSICTRKNVELAKANKSKHSKESFIYRMLSFIASAPDSKVRNQHIHLKFPIIYLKSGGSESVVSHLAKNPKLEVTDKQIRNTAKNFNISKDELKSLAQITQANGFSIPGLFSLEIGMNLFDKASMFNHSCDPNAFTFITYDKVIVYARRSIAEGEEITISYKPLCVPNISELLDFECKCGHCDRKSTILEASYAKFIENRTCQSRIDNMLEIGLEVPSSEHVQLLIESYYDVWSKNQTYRETDLYAVLKRFKLKEPDGTWIEAQLLALVIAHRQGLSDHFPLLQENLQPFLQNKDIIEHIVVTTTLIPNVYHDNLIEILGKMGVLP